MALIKYLGHRAQKKVCVNRNIYVFLKENDRTCEVDDKYVNTHFLNPQWGINQYRLVTDPTKKVEVAVEEYICKTCKKMFKSYQGLKAHQAKSHERVKGKSKAKPKKKGGKK